MTGGKTMIIEKRKNTISHVVISGLAVCLLSTMAYSRPASAQADLVRADFSDRGSAPDPAGVWDDVDGYYSCDTGDFDYAAAEDSGCSPDPGGVPGNHNSNVSGGGRWHFNLWGDDNPRFVTIDFSDPAGDPSQCDDLNTALAALGLSCGCGVTVLSTACEVSVWISADRLFKKGATRQTLGRFDIVETGGPDLRINYLDPLYICDADGHGGDKTWKTLQSGSCNGSLNEVSIAEIVIPPTGGIGQDIVLGRWELPFQITANRVPAPGDGGGEPPACTDNDNDGVCIPEDCDDNNPDIHPGHSDKGKNWGRDGIDNDCDGTPDR
jgi:hypothetical protein